MRSALTPFVLAASLLAPAALMLPATVGAQGSTTAPEAQAGLVDLAAPLTLDPDVRTGRFPNGLRYFVRQNGRPEKRAELRLVVNAGSILENDDQLGLAHFVEHMAFNGTRRFPKAEIVNYLERIGMRFGADVNAYTSFDETVYMLQVPTDTARLVSTALDILEDWAHGITFEPAELNKERGVVVEEWRTGRDASTRVSYRQFPVMLNQSKYADRIPIGTKENLETFPDSLASQFYRDWYRPDLMSVVAVGDFDPDEMIRLIEARFARIPMPAQPRQREYAPVPDHADTFVSIETDPEYPGKDVTLLWLKPVTTTTTVGDHRRELIYNFHDNMLNQRFAELTQRPDAPFVYAGGGRGEFVRTKAGYQLGAGVKENGFVVAAAALLAEAERARRFGFTTTEFDRIRTNYLRSLEQVYAERDNSASSGFAGRYVQMALDDEPVTGIARQRELGIALTPTITLDEVNAVARATLSDSNRVILVTGPDQPGTVMPTRDEMLGVFARAAVANVAAYVDSTNNEPLIATPPTPGRVVSERTLPETDIIEWTLSNGARMLLKPTDFKADEVLFAGNSPGGSSLVSDRDDLDATFGGYAVSDGGLGSFSSTTLRKKLAGIRASVFASVTTSSEYINGSASRKDLETLFQLAYLRFTQPRVDSSSFQAFVNMVRSMQENASNDPEQVFGDTIALTLSQNHPRMRLVRAAAFDSVDVQRALAIYKDRFAGADDFTFFLVGSFPLDSARMLTERYIASIPAAGRKEKARDLGIRRPPGVVEKTVRKGVEPKASNQFIFHGSCEYSYENRIVLDALQDLLDIRLREVLREDKSGTYGVGVSASCNSIPYSRYSVSVSFGSAPERREELVAAMWSVIDSVKAGVISDSNIVKIREMAVRSHETALKQNGSWIAAMQDADEDGRDQRDWLRAPAMTAKVTREQLRDAARKYLDRRSLAVFTLLPEIAPKPVPER
ncbi:MAG: insulinase family protein [Gemmatimonadetes bacterium]|nr:insulinase family protein [Gemmatimonadota bacterium]